MDAASNEFSEAFQTLNKPSKETGRENHKEPMIGTLGTLDSDQIPIRVLFEPINKKYFERMINIGSTDQAEKVNPDSLGDDDLALILMLNYFALVSGGSSDVGDLEAAFVNRASDAQIKPVVGNLFSGISLFEMINRANRAYKHFKRLPKLLNQSSGYEPGRGPLSGFSDDEIAELTFVSHASITGALKGGLYVGTYFKHLASEFYERINK